MGYHLGVDLGTSFTAAARPGVDDFVLLTGAVDPAANAADFELLIANGAAPDSVVLVGLNLDDVLEALAAPIDRDLIENGVLVRIPANTTTRRS